MWIFLTASLKARTIFCHKRPSQTALVAYETFPKQNMAKRLIASLIYIE